MYLRESKQRRTDGSTVSYLQLAENLWDPERRRSQTHVVYNCGRADDPAVVERLRRLAASILRRCSPEEIVAASKEDLRLVCAWPYGEVYVLQALWQRLGIDQVIRAQAQPRRLGFDVERALFAMVANRACAPCSKLYCWEQWLKEEVHIPGTQGLSLQHLYRAMDFLEANKEPIEREIFHRVADLLNLDVEVLFYDTTSLHFEIDQDDEGIGPDDLVHGSLAAGRKSYRAPRKRGLSKNGRGDAPQIVVGMAVTREGFPVRHWVFPGNTVDVTTVAQVKRDLRDWQLTRCLFVGDAGMVSAANFKALAAGGGKYLMCMPMRTGDALTQQVLSRAGRYRSVNERLQIKEVLVGDGERRLRYVVCFNPRGGSTTASASSPLARPPRSGTRSHGRRRPRCAEQARGRAAQLQPLGQVPHTGRQGAAARCQGDQGQRALRRQVPRPRQRRHAQCRGHGAGLQADDSCRAGLARHEEHAGHAPGVPLGAAPHPRARGHHGAVAAAGAHRGACLRGHLAQRLGPPAAHPVGAIVEPSRYGLASHRPNPGGG